MSQSDLTTSIALSRIVRTLKYSVLVKINSVWWTEVSYSGHDLSNRLFYPVFKWSDKPCNFLAFEHLIVKVLFTGLHDSGVWHSDTPVVKLNKSAEFLVYFIFFQWFYVQLLDLLHFYWKPDMKNWQFGDKMNAAFCSELYRQWLLLPSFLFDALRLTGMDKPVFFERFVLSW